MAASLPMGRIDVGGANAKAWDPGGRGWIVSLALWLLAASAAVLAWGHVRRPA